MKSATLAITFMMFGFFSLRVIWRHFDLFNCKEILFIFSSTDFNRYRCASKLLSNFFLVTMEWLSLLYNITINIIEQMRTRKKTSHQPFAWQWASFGYWLGWNLGLGNVHLFLYLSVKCRGAQPTWLAWDAFHVTNLSYLWHPGWSKPAVNKAQIWSYMCINMLDAFFIVVREKVASSPL